MNDLSTVSDTGVVIALARHARFDANMANARLWAMDHLTTVRARSEKQATALTLGFPQRNPPGRTRARDPSP